jgi:hypothetical protein
MDKKLAINAIIKDGLDIGLKNAVPILVNALLFILTVWIPYINIGTIIGISVGIPAKLSKGETLSMTEIFNPEYRKFMSEYFLTGGLVAAGVLATFILIVPAVVLSIAWMFAPLLAVDRKKSPLDAIALSNKVTYGNKGTIFLSFLILMVVAMIVGVIFMMIPAIGWILYLAVMVVSMFVAIGMQSYCYKELCSDL